MAKKKKTLFSNLLPAVSAHETVYALLQLPEETEDTLNEALQLQADQQVTTQVVAQTLEAEQQEAAVLPERLEVAVVQEDKL